MRGKNDFYGNCCMWAGTFCPRDEPFSIPLDIFLVILGHMFSYGAVLTWSSVQSGMRANPTIIVEDSNYIPGDADVYFMFYIFRKEHCSAFFQQIRDN